MSFESPQIEPEEIETEQEKEKHVEEIIEPTALAERVGKMIPALFRVETKGMENLDDIPEGKHIIFLTTHMSDYDVPIAIAALAEKFPKMKVAEGSTHEDIRKNLGGYLGRQIAGVENSFSVQEKNESGFFNPDDFKRMQESIEEGNTVVIAAYFDHSYQGKTWKIPEKGGNGGAYLGQITPDAVLVPVSIDIKSKKPFGMGDAGIIQIMKEMRPKVEVSIGKPIIPEKIDNVERFSEILNKRKNGEKLTPEDRTDFSRIRKGLRFESDKVMSSISEMLPPEKRFDPEAEIANKNKE